MNAGNNDPSRWIQGEVETYATRVQNAHKAIGEIEPGTHASTERVEWVLKTQAMHTVWSFAKVVFDRDGIDKAIEAMTHAALTSRIEQSTSAVGNWQSILLVEAYRRVAQELQSMKGAVKY